jgi:tetratricopeptide (TPR) repeat protein
MFLRVRCLALAVQAGAADTPGEVLDLRNRSSEFLEAQRAFVAHVSGELARDPDSTHAPQLRKWMARALLAAAEILILPQIDRADQALKTLDQLETSMSAEEATLAARIWRVRLVAYDKLGRLDDVTQAIPAFIAADPGGAAPVLQALYLSLADQVNELRLAGNDHAAGRKAKVALVLAKQIVVWAEENASTADQRGDRPWKVQLAEAYLQTGQYRRARELFEPLLDTTEATALPTNPIALRAMLGYAEALFHLGDWSAALPRFNRLAVALSPADPVRWKALLRDLQCRTALGHPPRDLITVIEQQRFLHPDLGGPALAAEFQKLQRQNQRRADAD